MNKNLVLTSTWLANQGYELSVTDNKIKVYCDNEISRKPLMEQLTNALVGKFSYNPDPAKGSSIGRLEHFDKNGNVFIFVKPKNGCAGQIAANRGLQYEKKILDLVCDNIEKDKLNIKQGGGGSGADLIINNKLKIEIKSSKDADFGQFTIQYDVTAQTWFINDTKKYRKNKAFYDNIFSKYLLSYLNTEAKLTCSYPDLRIKNCNGKTIIWGINSGKNTIQTKKTIEELWFDGRESKYFSADFADVAAYYLGRGDDYIQIQNRGLYAFKQNNFAIPTFQEKCGGDAKIRFRIKPHQKGGKHSFMISIRVNLQPSDKSLEDVELLKNILQSSLD